MLHRPVYNPQEVLSAVREGKDGLVSRVLRNPETTGQLRREVLAEYLYERGAPGAKIVCDEIATVHLPLKESRMLFLVAAESGALKVVKALLAGDPSLVDAATLRSAFRCAVRGSHIPIIGFLAETPRIPVGMKIQAVTPSLYLELSGSTSDGTPRSEMGIAETQIHKQAREQRATRSGIRTKKPSKQELARNEIYERYERLSDEIAQKMRRMRSDSTGHSNSVDNNLITELNVAMCQRELVRQRERSLFEIEAPSKRELVLERGAGKEVCRKTNPEGCATKRSVAELVADVYAMRLSGGEVSWNSLIEAILNEWSARQKPFSREQLSQLIGQVHPKGLTLSNVDSNVEMYKWKNQPSVKPYRQTVAILCKAFKLSLAQELMMWRIARGADPKEFEKRTARYRATSQVNSNASERSQLVKTLVAISGVPDARLEELLKVQQLSMWKCGARIEDLEMCRRFVELVNPQVLQPASEREAHREVNETLVGILSARPTSVVEAVTRAQVAPHPSGTCFLLLTGRYGLKQVSARDLSEKLGTSEWTIHRMRSTRQQRGGHISEAQAHGIADLVQGIPSNMRDSLTMVERYEREIMVDTLTGVRSPIALWHQFVSGDLEHVGEILRLTRIRRGDTQLPNTSDLELGKSVVGIRMANKLADYLGFVGESHTRVRREFILTAMGMEVGTTPEDLLNVIISGNASRLDGLRMMLDLSGRTRGQLAEALGVKKSVVMTWARSDFEGRISRPHWIRRLARELGLSHREDEMVKVFSRKRTTGDHMPPEG